MTVGRRRPAARRGPALVAGAAMLGMLAACSSTTRGHIAEANESPAWWLLSPLWLPMDMIYDGIGAVTGASRDDISGGLDLAVGAGAAAGAIYGASQGGGAPGYDAPPPDTGGYSQRGAFDDCARAYQGASSQRAAQCQGYANDIQSMGPNLQRQRDGSFVRQCGAHGCN